MSAPGPRPLAWVVGAGGLVGRHVATELRAAGHEVLTTTVPWHDEGATVRVLVAGRASGRWEVPGWTSTMILLMVASGVILFSLGVIAEYVGLAVNMAMGKPLYLPVRDRREGPLGRDRA